MLGFSGLYGSELAVIGDRLYIPDEVRGVIAYQANTGSPIWGRAGTGAWGLPLALRNDLAFGVIGSTLVAFEAERDEQVWRFAGIGDDWPWITAGESTVYVKTSATEITALQSGDGTVRWRATLDVAELGHGGSAALADGRLFVTIWQNKDKEGGLIALDSSTGRNLWSFSTGAEGVLDVAVANGVVYLTGWSASTVYAINPQDGSKLWSSNLDGRGGHLSIAAGNLFVTADSNVYAFGN